MSNNLTISINKMTCQSCAEALRKVLSQLGIPKDDIAVSFAKQEVILSNITTNASKIFKAIEEAGFTPTLKSNTFRLNMRKCIDPMPIEEAKTTVQAVDGVTEVKIIDDYLLVTTTLTDDQLFSKDNIASLFTLENINRYYFKVTETPGKPKISETFKALKDKIDNDILHYIWDDEQKYLTLFTALRQQEIKTLLSKFDHHYELKTQTDTDDYKGYFKRSLISALLGLPLLILKLTMIIPSPLTLPGQIFGIVAGVVLLPIILYCGKSFFKVALSKLRHGKIDQHILISLGVALTWAYSMIVAIAPSIFPVLAVSTYFAASLVILAFANLGQGIKNRALAKAAQKLNPNRNQLADLLPKKAFNANNEEIQPRNIKEKDILLVHPGDTFPADARLLDNKEVKVVETHINGEYVETTKGKDSIVYCGATNQSNEIISIQATQDYEQSQLVQLIDASQTLTLTNYNESKAITQITKYFIPIVLFAAVTTAIFWAVLGPAPVLPFIVTTVLSVLLCACPCVLGLAPTIAYGNATAKSLEKELLVSRTDSYDTACKIDTIIFDKTGTLTEGWPTLSDEDNHNLDADLLAYAMCAEAESKHSIARAFLPDRLSTSSLENVAYAVELHATLSKEEMITTPAPRNNGLKLEHGETIFYIGNQTYIQEQGVDIEEAMIESAKDLSAEDKTALFAVLNTPNSTATQLIVLSPDQLRADAKKGIQRLQDIGLHLIILSGGHKDAIKNTAESLGITVYHQQEPHQKAAYIKALQKRGHKVAMVGDGGNDSAALRAADLALTINPGALAAGVNKVSVSLNNKIENVPNFLTISKKTQRNTKQNMLWALIYNCISILLAAGVLYPITGFLVTPILASALMAMSSLFILFNANRLGRSIGKLLADDEAQNKLSFLKRLSKSWKQYSKKSRALFLLGVASAITIAISFICRAACGAGMSSFFVSITHATLGMACICNITMMIGLIGMTASLLGMGGLYTYNQWRGHGGHTNSHDHNHDKGSPASLPDDTRPLIRSSFERDGQTAEPVSENGAAKDQRLAASL